MRPPLFAKFVDKARAALVSAVEIYNKPGFRYREETFALLAINAWELLLKARLLKNAANDPRSIRVYESRRTKEGKASKKQYLKRSRAGSPLTLSLGTCITTLEKDAQSKLGPEIKANLDALVAIRDCAAHYVHASPVLAKQVLEVASATVKNFVLLGKDWFGQNLEEELSIVLPLSFLSGGRDIESVVVTADEDQLVKYLQELASAETGSHSPYAVAIKVQVRFERSKLATATKVQVTKDPGAVKVVLTEENIRERYPWDYRTLGKKCAERYANFKQDQNYHTLRRFMADDPRYIHSRYLDPGNPDSGKKDFYSPAVLDVFDKHYTKK